MIFLPMNVQAHAADTFTVVVKDTGLTPNSSQIMYNDSVIWHNVDSTENITIALSLMAMEMVCSMVQTIGTQVNCTLNVAQTIRPTRRTQIKPMIAI